MFTVQLYDLCSERFTQNTVYITAVDSVFRMLTQVYNTAITCSEWFIEPHTFTLQTQMCLYHIPNSTFRAPCITAAWTPIFRSVFTQTPQHELHLHSILRKHTGVYTTAWIHLQSSLHKHKRHLHHSLNSFRALQLHRRLHHGLNSLWSEHFTHTQRHLHHSLDSVFRALYTNRCLHHSLNSIFRAL